MNRRRAVTALAAGLLGSLVATTPALGAADTPAAHALSTQLTYRTVTWTSQGADMTIRAPRGWSFVLTPEGQARFNAARRPDLLTMGYRGQGALRPQLKAKVAALQGTPGLRILTAHGRGRGGTAHGGLRYLWTPVGGETRFVAYRYQGDDAYAVAGPLTDRKGLRAVLQIASDTGSCS